MKILQYYERLDLGLETTLHLNVPNICLYILLF